MKKSYIIPKVKIRKIRFCGIIASSLSGITEGGDGNGLEPQAKDMDISFIDFIETEENNDLDTK